MIPQEFDEQTAILKAPEGMANEVLDLPYQAAHDGNGYPYIVTCYSLNKEEIEMVQQTGRLYIAFMGYTIPPVLPSVENPFKQ